MAYNKNWQQEHHEALKSDAWNQRRNKYIQEHGHQCEKCGSTDQLELHHLEYTHEIGTEPDSHLLLLCPDCHHHIHSDIYIGVANPTFLMECSHCTTLNPKTQKVCQKCKKLI